MKNQTYYLVERINGGEYNIYQGTEKECEEEMSRIKKQFGDNASPMYITFNRFE